MSFRLVPKWVTLNDLERHNGRYFALFQRIRVASRAHCVKVQVRYLISWCVIKWIYTKSHCCNTLRNIVNHMIYFIMVALWNRADHYIFALWFLSFFFLLFFLSSPNLSRRELDVYHTSTHGVALVRIQNAGLKPAACGSLKNTGRKKSRQKSPSGHHRTNLSGYIFATKACIDNRKKMLSSNISSTCPHNMMNFGPLAAEIDPVVWGTPANFNEFRVLAALLHGI